MKKKNIVKWSVFLVILVGISLSVILNREWIFDFFRGISYQPSDMMADIRDKLQLTDRGNFLFKASRPSLSESDEFNAHCRQGGESEIAVLGCYTGGDIYIYNIEADELDGIRELTTAHELLHAVWARMSEEEKNELKVSLASVLNENQKYLGEEINTYDEASKQEELYVRAGTEIKDLPENLEKHYEAIFADQDLIVGFYDQYIAVFRRLELEMNGLKAEMGEIKTQIANKTAEYERRISQLEADIVSFNSCAKVAGCFASQGAFDQRRAALVSEQEALHGVYEGINVLVAEYNKKVEQYNDAVVYTEKLNTMINSSAKPTNNI